MSVQFTTLIDAAVLRRHLLSPDWRIIDCRFSLNDPEQGRRDYRAEHIPGALYAHLDEDLSAPVVPGKTGRHPLPAPAELAKTFSRWGIDEAVQVVAYDAGSGAIAARLWWMLRWLGHDAVAVLNGGWAAWQAAGFPTETQVVAPSPRQFRPRIRSEWVVSAEELEKMRRDPGARLIDAREADRYRGENEPIDPVAGHIPGALNVPYSENLTPKGRFCAPEALRERFSPILQNVPPEAVACYCGSGVTACHNLLAIKYAGLGDARLYPGSWSEWITDPNRPVATGTESC